jgi:glycosyltransferase involved in cell wall biosynthesis
VEIVIATRRFWPAIGGIERVAMELARELAQSHHVSIVAQRIDDGPHGRLTHVVREPPRFRPFAWDGVTVRQLRLPRTRRALLLPFVHETVPLLARIALRHGRRFTASAYTRAAAPQLEPLIEGADVVHVLGGEWLAVATVDLCRRMHVPVVITPFIHRGAWGDDAGSVRAYSRADRVLATLECDARVLSLLGVEPQKIEICGVPCRGLTPGSAHLVADRLPADAPLVTFIGDRRPNKGVDLLLAAADLIWGTSPHVHFAFVGTGPALRSGDPRVLDVGPVADRERSAWVDRCSVLALPSESETFGIVVAEAWSLRRPVVVSDIPPLRELVGGARGGVVVSRNPAALADAILAVLASSASARDMGARGYEFWRSTYTPEVVAARHESVYQRVINEVASSVND